MNNFWDEVASDHLSTISVALQAFVHQQERQQQAIVVLLLLQHLGVDTTGDRLTLEALQLFHEILTSHDRDWRIGSIPGRLPNIDRGREAAYQQLVNDYFSGANSTYPESKFRRRFRMRRQLFERIVERLGQEEIYFQQRPDALGKMGASTIQKVTAALRLLAYGGCADQLDEWI